MWIAVTYAAAIVFEVLKVLLASERSMADTLVGAGGPDGVHPAPYAIREQ